jgi:biotin carboxylase
LIEITPPELDSDAALMDMEKSLAAKDRSEGGPNLIFPLDDSALWLCNRLKAKPGWILVGPHGAAAELALDKTIQIQSARAAGFNVLPTTVANTTSEVLTRCKDLPLMLRPASAVLPENGRLRKGRNWICATRTELDRAITEWAGAWPLLVQPFVSGHGEGVFGLATGDGVRAWSAHRRLRMMNPHGSGSSACVSQLVPLEIGAASEAFIQKTGWRGLFMVELLRDHSGKLWFVEFNGRAWGSLALARRQGLEYPAWAARLALNPEAGIGLQRQDEKQVVCRNVGREFMHLLFVLRGPKSKAFQEWPSFWRTARELLRVRRNDFFYNWRRDDFKVFFSTGGIPCVTMFASRRADLS